MVARIPLIVNSSAEQIQELPSGDSISIPGDLDVTGSVTGNALHGVKLTADGTIAANAAVVLTSAGKVKTISSVAESVAGSSSTWFASNGSSQAVYALHDGAWFGSQNAAIIAWKIKSSTSSLDQRLQIQAGTLSGTSVSWGTQLNVDELTANIAVASNGNDKAILMYDLGSATRIRTFTVSGTTITLGNLVTVRADSAEGSLCYLGEDGGSEYFAVAYKQTTGSGNESYIKIIKHDGHNNTTLSSTQYQVEGATTNTHSTTHLIPISHNKFIVQVGQLNGNTTMHICTRNGTTTKIGQAYTSAELGTATDTVYLHQYHNNGSAYDPINKKYIIWHNAGNEQEGSVRVYNIDGTSFNFQFESDFVDAGVDHTHYSGYPTVEVTDKGQIVVTFGASSNHYSKRVVGDYNDERDGITWGAVTTWSSEDTDSVQQVKADDGKIINVYASHSGSAGYTVSGKSLVFQTATTTLTADNFLGFSAAGYSDGNTASISVLGSKTTQSSLTIGKDYYVQDNGTIGIGKSSFGVIAGKALSATSLLITPV